MRGWATIGPNGAKLQQTPASLVQRGFGRHVQPTQARRVGNAPQGTIQQQWRQVCLQNLRRIKGRHACARGFLPKPIGDPRSLSRSTTGALGGSGLARPFGHQSGRSSRPIITRASGKPAVNHNAHAVDGQAGFGNRGSEDDFAPQSFADRRTLFGRLQATVKPVDVCRDLAQPFRRAFDLRYSGKERQHIAFLLLDQRLADRGRHFILNSRLGLPPDMPERQRVRPPLTLNDWSVHQLGKSPAIERRRHRHQPQIGSQPTLRIQRQRQPEVAVEATFMNFVEQHRRHARKLRIALYAIAENALGQHQDARCRRLPAVHSGRIADALPYRLARQFRHPLRRRACRQPTWRKQ